MRRPTRVRTAAAVVATALVLSACAGGGTGDDTASGDETPTDEASLAEETPTDGADPTESTEAPTADAGDEDETTDPELAAVRAITATGPDGEVFSIGDYEGQAVLVETFATWCSTCRRQLGATQEAAVAAGDDAVFLVLSVETSLDPGQLAAYAEDNGFTDVRFGVLDEQGLVALEQVFGRSVLNPPSTPKFRIAADGVLSGLTTGLESADEILASLA